MSTQTTWTLYDLEWSFGDRIRKLRSVTGLGIREFGQRIGVNHTTLNAWERGTSQPRHALAIARAIGAEFGVAPEWVLGETEDPRPGGPDGGLPRQWAHWESNPEPAGNILHLVTAA